MVNEQESPSETSVSPADDLHNGSGFAVPNAKWYIAECKPTRERTIRTMLQKANYEAYVASRMEVHTYKSRNKRQVEKVVIPSKVFVHTEQSNLIKILYEYSAVYRFMLNKAVATDKNGIRPFAVVPDDQMQQLQYVLGYASNPVFLTADDLELNQKIRIMRGPLTGLEGFFFKKGHSTYIVVKVEMGTRHYVYTEVSIDDVQTIE